MSGADPEAEYFQSVEELFVSRRGDPLFLSNADWFLVWKWRRAGIPLRVVLRGIGDAFDAREQSWSHERRVGSLAYCAAEVEAAADRWRRAVDGGDAARPEAGALLLRLAGALEAASPPGLRAGELAPRLAARLRRRAPRAVRGAGLDRWLASREQELVAALLEDLGPAAAAAAEQEVDAALAGYRERLPRRVLEPVRQESLARRVLESCGLPRLSLFHAGEGD